MAGAAVIVLASFWEDVRSFASALGDLELAPLIAGLALFVLYLSIRAFAFRNILAASYPRVRVPYVRIWGAYIAAYGFNNVIPARGGDVLKLYLVRSSIPGASYPTIAAALLVEGIFDLCAGALAVSVVLALGVFPQPPAWASISDLGFLTSDWRRTLFLLTLVAVAGLVVYARTAGRIRRFWQRVEQGFRILRDGRAYLRRVWLIQAAAWLVRGAAFFFLLQAFRIPADVGNVFSVLSANAVGAVFPFTPGGAGIVQAMLVDLLSGSATAAQIAAFGVGLQASIALTTLIVGFAALAWLFRLRSFREAVARGRADRDAEREAELAARRQRPT